MNKTIMILGAGIFQVPLIVKAKEMGFNTIVVSPPGDYPGIELADQFLESDIRDTGKIISAIERSPIDGIVTSGSDVGIPTIGSVSDYFVLKGPTREMAEVISYKTNFRQFLKDNNLNFPPFKKCETITDALQFYQSARGKVVVKPDDSSGSRGISILHPCCSDDFVERAYHLAFESSYRGIVCIEEFIDGIEAGGEAFVLNGKIVFFCITHKHMEGVIVRGHSLPASLSSEDCLRVKEELARVVKTLKYLNGPLNFDVILSSGKATFIEIALRSGGNGITDIVYLNIGVDLHQVLLEYAVDLEPSIKTSDRNTPVSSYVFGTTLKGVLKRMPAINELKRAVPEVLEITYAKKPGNFIEAFTHNANLAGYLLLDSDSVKYNEIVARIESVLEIEVA